MQVKRSNCFMIMLGQTAGIRNIIEFSKCGLTVTPAMAEFAVLRLFAVLVIFDRHFAVL